MRHCAVAWFYYFSSAIIEFKLILSDHTAILNLLCILQLAAREKTRHWQMILGVFTLNFY